ncbi:DedA family protein [Paenibacillus xerothermodurans]|uniref:DedA family protein n=1 Tax=Paenibacillus xerothermodurans TaxID=1977292 RepID=A0A2W1P0T3_PAEXE|nr:DedA family protein [Paenibacillus xerothermodurans]PZE21352.1 DedA family protein [Paenibacillus xerothermodurans]
MANWITEIINSFGYIGIFLLIALENIFPPIPSEVILTFGGFMTTNTKLSITGVILVSTLGSVTGAIVLYIIGMQLSTERLERLVDKWGRIFRITRKDVHRSEKWFQKYGAWTVFFCRLVPLVRSLISIPAGMARMNFWKFLLLTTTGTLIWNSVLVNIGAAMGNSWENVLHYMDMYSNFAYLALGLLVVWMAVRFSTRKNKHKEEHYD